MAHSAFRVVGRRFAWALSLAGALVRSAGAAAATEAAAVDASEVVVEAASQQLHVGDPTAFQKAAYLLRTVEKFKASSHSARLNVERRHRAEEVRLSAAINEAEAPGTRLALAQSLSADEQALKETERVYENIEKFSESMSAVLAAATSGGTGCEELVCGEHASCTVTSTGAECICNEGYVGLGKSCHAPADFKPHRLISPMFSGGLPTQALDMHVAAFHADRIAVVFRDVSQGNAGKIVFGSAREGGLADLAPPQLFTTGDGKAFSPVVAGTEGGRLAVAWRDENRMGACWVRGAAVGSTNIRGADLSLSWGDKVNFCTGQAHKMAFAALPGDRVAILFSDRAKATLNTPAGSFGNSVLASINDKGGVSLLGQFRFSDHPVCRLEATKFSPTAFIIAARAGSAVDDLDASVSTKQEAMAIYAEVIDNDLVFNPNPANIEPTRSQIWSRGVSLIAPDTFAYAYQDGVDMKVKMAVIEVNPNTHMMEVVQRPSIIRDGFSNYVSMLATPYMPSQPHTLVYYEDHATNRSMVNLCSWSLQSKKLEQCEDFAWLNQKPLSVSGAPLPGGKILLAFAAAPSGEPHYAVLGLGKK